jgi:hypothetical protein
MKCNRRLNIILLIFRAGSSTSELFTLRNSSPRGVTSIQRNAASPRSMLLLLLLSPFQVAAAARIVPRREPDSKPEERSGTHTRQRSAHYNHFRR